MILHILALSVLKNKPSLGTAHLPGFPIDMRMAQISLSHLESATQAAQPPCEQPNWTALSQKNRNFPTEDIVYATLHLSIRSPADFAEEVDKQSFKPAH